MVDFRVSPNHPVVNVSEIPKGEFFKRNSDGKYFLRLQKDLSTNEEGVPTYSCVGFPERSLHHVSAETRGKLVPNVSIVVDWNPENKKG